MSQQVTISATLGDQLAVMVNGVPGKMASATAEEVVRRGMTLANEALTGPGMRGSVLIEGTEVALSPPEGHVQCLQRVRNKYPKLILVDYTHPSAANKNVEKYAEQGLSFVIGTTGGDEDAMRRAVSAAAGVYAVIAPNMGKQIVAFQAMMEMMAKEFPGAFAGYKLSVKESHQATKADTSGTAKSTGAALRARDARASAVRYIGARVPHLPPRQRGRHGELRVPAQRVRPTVLRGGHGGRGAVPRRAARPTRNATGVQHDRHSAQR
ncbi:Dihydrodipicolinate reductase [Gracilaria domingensis]|nr:Dihydrodipicolinate reductase [Gracilaria domingensis]